MKRTIKIILFNLLAIAILLEISLRFIPYFKTSSEKSEGVYVNYYGQVKNSWYHTWEPNSNNTISSSNEFNFHFKANSLGLREKEFSKNKPDTVTRIMVLGDSYVAGVGADSNDTWPSQLEKILNGKYDHRFEVINAGVSGSDPFYCYTLLRDKLITYTPDAVIVAVNTSDIYDFIYRGGRERFYPDGTTHYKLGPWFEPLFHYSYFFRFLVRVTGYGKALERRSEIPKWNRIATDSIASVLADSKMLCDRNQIKFLSVIHPNGGFAIQNLGNTVLKSFYYSVPADIHLLGKKLTYTNNIDVSTELMKEVNDFNYKEYVWPSDKHFTAKGYAYFASIVYDNVLYTDSDFFKIQQLQTTTKL